MKQISNPKKKELKICVDIYGEEFFATVEYLSHLNFQEKFTILNITDPGPKIVKRVGAMLSVSYKWKDSVTSSFVNVNFFRGPIKPNEWFEFDNFIPEYLNMKRILYQYQKERASEKNKKEIDKLIKKFEKKLTLENRLRLEVYDG